MDAQTILTGLLVLAGMVLGAANFIRKERLPNVEFLRISDKRGEAGDQNDVQAFLSDSLSAILKGYNQYSKHGKNFLLRTPKQVYLMAAPKFLEEIRKAPESTLSQPAAANIIFQTAHTLHPALVNDSYHFKVVQSKVTQALAYNIPDLVDETRRAFDIELQKRQGWTQAQMYPFASNVVTRVSNRMLVGPELCRNEEFLHYSGDYTRTTFNAAAILRNYPEFMKSTIMFFMTDRRKQLQIARKYLLSPSALSVRANR